MVSQQGTAGQFLSVLLCQYLAVVGSPGMPELDP